MTKLALPLVRHVVSLLVLFLALAASAQTVITDSAKEPAGCSQITHCWTTTVNTNSLIWTNSLSFLEYDGYYADNVTTYDLSVAPGTDHSQRYPFTLHTVGTNDADTFSVDMALAGYKFYSTGGGGRACGGCGWKYAIQSWSVKVTIN